MNWSEQHGRHSVNFFVSTELKLALKQLSQRSGRTMADTIRLALNTAVPILNGLWDAEDRLLADWTARQSRRRRLRKTVKTNNKDADPGDKGS